MKKVIRLTEADLFRIIKRVLNEQETKPEPGDTIKLFCLKADEGMERGLGVEIGPVEFVRFDDRNLESFAPRLYLQRPDDSIAPETWNKTGEYDLAILPIKNLRLKKISDTQNSDKFVMTYNVGGTHFCSPRSGVSETWKKFFEENKIYFGTEIFE